MGSSFEDLEVWKKSCRLSVRLYKLLRDCRDYGMKDQMPRSSISIPSNIAEGSEKKSIPDFQRLINVAQGSAAELRTQVYISQEVNPTTLLIVLWQVCVVAFVYETDMRDGFCSGSKRPVRSMFPSCVFSSVTVA